MTTNAKNAKFLLKTNRIPPVLNTSIKVIMIFKSLVFNYLKGIQLVKSLFKSTDKSWTSRLK